MSRRSHLTKRQEWKKRLARYAKSDQTVAQFCLDEGVSAPSLYYWRKRLLLEPTETTAAAPARFQPVRVVPSLATPCGQATIIRLGRKLEIVDYPRDLQVNDPDGPRTLRLGVGEEITAVLPNDVLDALGLGLDSTFSVEYIAVLVQNEVLDRAVTQGMNFDVPIFPSCVTNPVVAQRGKSTTVVATGLLPSQNVHVFLGDEEVATGVSDAEGSTSIEFTIPADSWNGDRLVTVGSLAVTADCFVTVPEPASINLAVLSVLAVSGRLRRQEHYARKLLWQNDVGGSSELMAYSSSRATAS